MKALTIFTACMALAASAYGQNPIQKEVTRVSGSPNVNGERAEIIPLLWRARIGDAVTAIPLVNIEHYGIQDYLLDNQTKIRELTITLKSRSMVRIYHILPLGGLNSGAAQRLQQLPGTGTAARKIQGMDKQLPIKTYPTTTHEKMVEYRVPKAEHVDKLFDSLDTVMVTYLGRNLDRSQRSLIVEAETVATEEEEDGLETGSLNE